MSDHVVGVPRRVVSCMARIVQVGRAGPSGQVCFEHTSNSCTCNTCVVIGMNFLIYLVDVMSGCLIVGS